MLRYGAPLFALMLLLAAPRARAGGPADPDLPDLVAKLLPSVVNFSSVKIDPPTPSAEGQAAATKPVGTRRKSLGSGFIIDPSGIILTNKHVVEGTTDISVTLHDGTVLSAQVLSDAGRSDLAIVRVTPEAPLPAVSFGDSDELRQGDMVIAIGNPLGFSSSVTTGIVSALDRDVKTSPYDAYIQTDASINQGNSGGPLFNRRGQVIGVNTALITANDAGGSIGIGLSIPANDARFIVQRLMKYGRVRPGWVGLEVQQMSQAMAEVLGLKRVNGVIVTGFDPGQTGLRNVIEVGDVIEAVQDYPVKDVRQFNRAVGVQPVGSIIGLILWRDGVRRAVKVQVDEDPEDVKNVNGMASDALDDGYVDAPNFGLVVENANEANRASFGLPATAKGVVVTSVVANSRAADQGFLPGDMILRVQKTPVRNVDELWREVANMRAKRNTRMLLLLRSPEGQDRFVVMPTA